MAGMKSFRQIVQVFVLRPGGLPVFGGRIVSWRHCRRIHYRRPRTRSDRIGRS